MDVKWSLASEPETDVQVDDYTGDITVEGSFGAAVTHGLANPVDDAESGDSAQEEQTYTDTHCFTGSVDFTTGTPTVTFDDQPSRTAHRHRPRPYAHAAYGLSPSAWTDGPDRRGGAARTMWGPRDETAGRV
ncbi:hypothetical protein ACH4F6_05435 [Streptomyces sp. NPDC017936]|uniref:hypothetical protein n=1 Tax=Streptomyces sp. NPDC017936 TaxID=3365016 RepID=UPI003787BC3C